MLFAHSTILWLCHKPYNNVTWKFSFIDHYLNCHWFNNLKSLTKWTKIYGCPCIFKSILNLIKYMCMHGLISQHNLYFLIVYYFCREQMEKSWQLSCSKYLNEGQLNFWMKLFSSCMSNIRIEWPWKGVVCMVYNTFLFMNLWKTKILLKFYGVWSLFNPIMKFSYVQLWKPFK
jgi:hypothetical protein